MLLLDVAFRRARNLLCFTLIEKLQRKKTNDVQIPVKHVEYQLKIQLKLTQRVTTSRSMTPPLQSYWRA